MPRNPAHTASQLRGRRCFAASLAWRATASQRLTDALRAAGDEGASAVVFRTLHQPITKRLIFPLETTNGVQLLVRRRKVPSAFGNYS